MKALMRKSRGLRGARAFRICAAGAALVLLSCAGADAAAIHHHRADASARPFGGMPAAELAVFKEWSRYLLAGPTAWATVEHPPWTQTVQSAVWASIRTDPGPTDPMINFLLWKQSIDPPRFVHYHPALAPALHRIAMTRSSPTLIAPVTPTTSTSSVRGTWTTPSAPTRSPTILQHDLNPPAVPEPSMLLLAAGMTAWAFRRMRGHHRTRGE